MRYELSDYEWTAIKPMLPNKPRGVRRVNDRRVLNGIFWVLRSGAPWRDLPETYGPRTTCYNRFVRWRRAGVWDRIMEAMASGHDAAVQMIDTSVVRVHQHGACIADNNHQDMGRSRGGLTSKLHAVVDANGLPVHLALTPGEAHDNRLCSVLLSALLPQTILLADRGYDADWIRELARQQGAWANIPPKRNRKDPICFSPYLYPLVIMFCIVGVYEVNHSIVDVWIMLIMGVVGYGLRKFGLDPAPLVLGLVIAPTFEMSLRQSLIMSNGNWTIFVQRPIAAVLIAVCALLLALAALSVIRARKDWRSKLAEAESGEGS